MIFNKRYVHFIIETYDLWRPNEKFHFSSIANFFSIFFLDCVFRIMFWH